MPCCRASRDPAAWRVSRQTRRRKPAGDRPISRPPERRHDHGGIAFEEQNVACRVHREIDAAVIELERGVDPLERRHAARPDEARHVVEKGAIVQAIAAELRHVGAEIMHLPVARNRQVQRIELAVDDHDADLAKHPLAVARIELLDQPHVIAGQFAGTPRRVLRAFDADEIAAGMETRHAQQKRKGKTMSGDHGRRTGTGERAPRHRRHARRHDVRQSAEPFGIRSAPGLEHRKRMIDHRPAGVGAAPCTPPRGLRAQISASPMLLKTTSCAGNAIFGIVIFRHQNAGLENLLVEQRSRRRIAAGGRDQKQHPDRRPRAAIRQRGQEIVLETLVAMRPRARRVADLGQQIAHAAVGMNMVGIGAQGGFEMRCAPRRARRAGTTASPD